MQIEQNIELDKECIDTIRFLSLDMVQKAKSGHPGTPMGAAAMTYTLWNRILKHNPRNPAWIDRDRFVLSPGHASALLYSLLFLTGYDLSMDELRNFRQWGSKTPGHPEYGVTPGVEVTTGPLGQGFANGVGMAIAERWLADQYNREGFNIFDHYTYGIASDGDLQEGVASEAASLAGTLHLGKIIYLYDDNGTQIGGSTDIDFREDVARRFSAYGWQVIGPISGDEPDSVEGAIRRAQREKERPSLIICSTLIGRGAPEEGTAEMHSDPLSEDAVKSTKMNAGWPSDKSFYVPDDVLSNMRKAVDRGLKVENEWEQMFSDYTLKYPDLSEKLQVQIRGDLPSNWTEGLEDLFAPGAEEIATRDASGKILNILIKHVPALIGGSADLDTSTKTTLFGYGDFGWHEYAGNNIHFGVREHSMAAIAGGMSLHGGIIPYAATFLTFSDYMRPPMRLASMMGIRVIYIFSHDSIALGQDGPTHQPIEQLMGLREVPNLTIIRPSDATEAVWAWRMAISNSKGPTALILTRQKLPIIDRSVYAKSENLRNGGYVLWESRSEMIPDIILIATGSEVHLALEAGKRLSQEEGSAVRVVSMPSWELFDKQTAAYREDVLPSIVRARVAVEAGIKLGWEHYVGLDGAVVGMEGFGASAPAEVLFTKFGFTADNVVRVAKDVIIRIKNSKENQS
jgi:transketolase